MRIRYDANGNTTGYSQVVAEERQNNGLNSSYDNLYRFTNETISGDPNGMSGPLLALATNLVFHYFPIEAFWKSPKCHQSSVF